MIRLCAFSDEAAPGIDGQIAALKRNGIALTELRSVDGQNVADFSLETAKAYRDKLAGEGISVFSVGSPLGKVPLSADFGEYEKTVRHVCELANVFGCERVRMFSFYEADGNLDEVLYRLDRMVEIGAEYGVFMCHENEKKIYGETVSRVLEILNGVPGLRSVYDPANFLQAGEDPAVSIEKLTPGADYFHIKDVISATGELVPAGYGDGRIQTIVDGIKGDKVLTVEPHLALFDAYAKIDGEEMKHRFHFANGDEAFDFAVVSLKKILKNAGYRESGTEWVR